MNYRADIQLLRGIAVLLVVMFHLSIPGFSSGFLGVDVFFVVSGFLMAVLYKGEGYGIYLTRRARRLLPAYFVTIITTVIGAYFFTTQNELNQVITQSQFATVFLSNVGFWLQNSYFNKAEFNPLLHLWSLGVEIQFYVIVPALFLCIQRVRHIPVLLTLLSIFMCFAVLQISPKTSFFMMPLRLWEFMIGFCAARYLTDTGTVKVNHYTWLGVVGLLTILFIPFIPIEGDGNSITSGHPGLIAFLISVCTALVLVCGTPSRLIESAIGKVLITLGNYSYSVYLAHFPIIVIYLSQPFKGTSLNLTSVADGLILIGLIFLFSVALHHAVEKRTKSRSLIRLALIPMALTVAVSVVINFVSYQRLDIDQQKLFNAFSDRSVYRCGKTIRFLDPTAVSCTILNLPNEPERIVLLVGNSHADSIKTEFAKKAEELNYQVDFLVANNPLMAGGLTHDQILNEAIQLGADAIVLHYSPEALAKIDIQPLINSATEENVTVSLIEPVPVWEEHIPRALYLAATEGRNVPQQTLENYRNYAQLWNPNISQLNSTNFKRYSTSAELCQPNCKLRSETGEPLYFDHGHLTLTGSRQLHDLFQRVLAAL